MKYKISLLKITYFIFAAFIIFILSACGSNKINVIKSTNTDTSNPTKIAQPSPSPKHLDDGDIPFKYRVIGIDSQNADKYRFSPEKCESTKELNKFLGEDSPKEYDDNFFKDYTVFLFYKESTTGSTKYTVKNVERVGGRLSIDIDESVPSIVTADMAYRFVIVEIKKSFLYKDDHMTYLGINLSSLKPDSTCPPGFVNGDIPFSYKVVGTDKEIKDKKTYIKFQSTEEVKGYLGNDISKEYDDNFFKENTLILLLNENSKKAVKFRVDEVKRLGGDIYIDLQYVSPALASEKTYSYIAVTIKNKFLDKNDYFLVLGGLDYSTIKSLKLQ
jgi:hypothetical protein